MQTLVKVNWAKLCILSLLLFAWGTLLPAYACPSEVNNAVAQLQKSARAKISAEDWLAQIVSKTSYLYDVTSRENVTERGSGEKLRTALFSDKKLLTFLKKYLADVRIRQNTHDEWESPRKFQFNEKINLTYYYIYPFGVSRNDESKSACQLGIKSTMIHETKGSEFGGESALYYFFDLEDGEMKLVEVNVAG